MKTTHTALRLTGWGRIVRIHLRELGIPFGIIGALVPELLVDARPPRMTASAFEDAA